MRLRTYHFNQYLHINLLQAFISTDVNAVSLGWDTPKQRAIKSINYSEFGNYNFAEGSMGTKVKAASQFIEKTDKVALIGYLGELEKIVKGIAGTKVSKLTAEMGCISKTAISLMEWL